jgi:hypothetical protein
MLVKNKSYCVVCCAFRNVPVKGNEKLFSLSMNGVSVGYFNGLLEHLRKIKKGSEYK